MSFNSYEMISNFDDCRKELPYLIPEIVRKMSDYQPQQWLNRIHSNMQEISRRGPLECKARFVGKSTRSSSNKADRQIPVHVLVYISQCCQHQ